MRIICELNEMELTELNKPVIGVGGFQALIRHLRNQVDSENNLSLDNEMAERIYRYAFKYDQGGWQDRLVKIFGRHLGKNLDQMVKKIPFPD